jgi:hypothetical protein
MTTHVAKEVLKYFTRNVFQWEQFSRYESRYRLRKAVQHGVPPLVTEILAKASHPRYAESMLGMARQAYANEYEWLAFAADHRPVKLALGLHLQQRLFSENFNLLAKAFAESARIRNTSAHSLLSLTGLIVLAIIGKRAAEENMDAAELCRWLSDQYELSRGLVSRRRQTNGVRTTFRQEGHFFVNTYRWLRALVRVGSLGGFTLAPTICVVKAWLEIYLLTL